MPHHLPDRRSMLHALAAGTAGASFAASAAFSRDASQGKGNIKQSICRWCYAKIPIDKLAAAAKKLGYQSIELLLPADYAPVKDAGLSCAMIGKPSIPTASIARKITPASTRS